MSSPISTNTLLAYEISTIPSPVQVSIPDKTSSYATMTILVSNDSGDETLKLDSITITIPIGDAAGALTTSLSSIELTVFPADTWSISKPTADQIEISSINQQPVSVTTEGIRIELANILINNEVGAPQILITESAESSSDPLEDRLAIFQVGKFPSSFYFYNFAPSSPMVSDGQHVTLTWSGSTDATYTMYWNIDEQEDVTNTRSWISRDALTQDTTFKLVASVKVGQETVPFTLTTTVIVADPELEVTSLRVNGISDLRGKVTAPDVTVNGLLLSTTQIDATKLTIYNDLTALGSANVTFENMTTKGSIYTGSLETSANLVSKNYTSFTGFKFDVSAGTQTNFNGQTNLYGETNLKGQTNVIGASNFTDLLTAQKMNVMAELVLKGKARIINKPYGTGPGSNLTAKTDLLITANVSGKGGDSLDKVCYGTVSISSEGCTNNASGGNIAGSDKTAFVSNGACTSFIRKDQSYSLTFNYVKDDGDEVVPNYAFYVWEIGDVDSSTLESSVAAPPPPDPEVASKKADLNSDKLASEIMQSVKNGDEKALAELLRKMLRISR